MRVLCDVVGREVVGAGGWWGAGVEGEKRKVSAGGGVIWGERRCAQKEGGRKDKNSFHGNN